MTIINHAHRFIFIHVPKTAGTAITFALGTAIGDSNIRVLNKDDAVALASRTGLSLHKHSTAIQIRRALGRTTFDEFFKFGVARNPFERTISIFRFLKYTFRAWPNAGIMDGFDTIDQFVSSEFFRGLGPGGIFRPQIHWLADRKKRLLVDHLCRMESLESDLASVKEKLNVSASLMPADRRNTSGGDFSAIASGLNSGTVVDAIRLRYAEDFEILGYPVQPERCAVPDLTVSPQTPAGDSNGWRSTDFAL